MRFNGSFPDKKDEVDDCKSSAMNSHNLKLVISNLFSMKNCLFISTACYSFDCVPMYIVYMYRADL